LCSFDFSARWAILFIEMLIALVHDPIEKEPYSSNISTIGKQHQHVTHAIHDALFDLGHEVVDCRADECLIEKMRKTQPDMAFNLSVRINAKSRLSYAPALLKELGIPFSGSGPQACANAYDKYRAKKILENAGVRTPKGTIIRDGDEIRLPRSLVFPLFVKPVRGGCSKGIRKENLIKEKNVYKQRVKRILQRVGKPLLVEEYIAGREFTVGLLGNKDLHVLPIAEFINKKGKGKIPFRHFTRKMIDYEQEIVKCPAQLAATVKKATGELAVQAYRSLGCCDYARIDVRLDGQGQPSILEVNALPNLVPEESTFSLMALCSGISFCALIEAIITSTCRRHNLRYTPG